MQLVADRKLPVIFFLIVSVNHVYPFEIPTCCPDGYEVIKSGNVFFCDLYSDGEFPIYLNPISGFLIRNSSERNIPKCENIHIYPISRRNTDLSLNSCVAILRGTYVILSCQILSNNEPKTQVQGIKKCCPIGESYNFNEKTCEISKPTSYKEFSELLSIPTVFEKGDLDHCINESVIIQYFTLNSDFRLDYQDLIVDGQRYFSDSYCLESVLPTSGSNITDEDLDEGYEILPSRQIFMARTCHGSDSICDEIPCVRRCCGGWEKLTRINNASTCVPHPADMSVTFHNIRHDVDNQITGVPVKPKAFGVLHHQPCKKYILDTDGKDEDIHYFSPETGNMYVHGDRIFYDQKDYCIEYTDMDSEIELSSFVCFPDTEQPFYAYILIVSCVFLILTLFVYLFLPRYLNLHGKTLTCYVSSLLVGYIILAVTQLSTSTQLVGCYTIAIIMYFSFMSAFAWLNVMCIDIWWTFGHWNNSVDRAQGMRKKSEWKRFLFYSLYAWGLASVFTLITFCIDYYRLANKRFHPDIGNKKCWFGETAGVPHLIFFLIPIGILVIANIVLFVLTLRYCNKVKNEIHRMQSVNTDKSNMRKRFSADKAKMAMNLKLFIVMGVSWFLEIISAIFYNHKAFFYISDVFNAFQGILIFSIFVCKRRTYEALKQQLGLAPKRRTLGGTTVANTATTAITSSTDQRSGRMRSVESCTSLLPHSVSSSMLAKKLPPLN